MANPTGILNADEDHSARKITNIVHPPVADHDAATKKYVDDNIVSGTTSDTVFGSSWNGVTTIAPSKNAVYDWAHTFDTDDDGKVNVLDMGAGIVQANSVGAVSAITVGSGLTFTGGTLSAIGGGSGTVTTTGAPVTGNLTKFSGGTSITNGDLTGNVTTSGTMATTIANSAVTYAKIQNVSANSKLLGSNATGSGAPPSEITLGTNLSMSGSTLNAAGGGGSGTIASTNDILKGDGAGNAVALGSATSGKVLKSNGTAFVGSTETYAAPGTSGNLLTSDGTNWTSAAPVVTAGSTTTFTNKRINPRVDASTSASATTWAPNSDTTDIFELAGALSVAVTTISNPSGTPVDGQKLIIRVKSDGSAHALTWSGSQWRASSDLALPTTTIISKTLYLGFIYNSVDTKWDLLALLNNF